MSNLNDRLTGNVLEPLLMEEGEILVFLRDRRCGLCGFHLLAKHAPDRKWIAYCIHHGDVTETSHISAHDGEKLRQDILEGKRHLRKPAKPRPIKDILEEIGYD